MVDLISDKAVFNPVIADYFLTSSFGVLFLILGPLKKKIVYHPHPHQFAGCLETHIFYLIKK